VAARSGAARANMAPCACVPGCVCVNARRVFGEVPQRLGRDANATSRPHHGVAAHGEAVAGAWRGLGRGQVSRHGCARTRAGPGFPGPRRGRAVHGARASRARGTMWRRRGDGGCGVRRRRDGLLHERRHESREGEVVLRLGYGGLIGLAGNRGIEGRGRRRRSLRACWRDPRRGGGLVQAGRGRVG
jgi:hypothetical protein